MFDLIKLNALRREEICRYFSNAHRIQLNIATSALSSQKYHKK